MDTKRLTADESGIAQAEAFLRDGQLVALPTETVYGLAADARDDHAVARIFEAKARPRFNPLIVHIADVAQAARYVEWLTMAAQLAAAFWPGPLTMVLPLKAGSGLSPLVTSELDTLALRMPAHPAMRAVLRAFGGPVAAPSANPSGRISPTTAEHVLAGLDGRIAAVLDGGPCPVGVESTIVGLSGEPVLLREGGIAREDIEAVLGMPLATHQQGETLTAPGQMTSHYAPAARVRLNAQSAEAGEVFLGFGPMVCDLNLSERGDLLEAAARLFSALHAVDARGAQGIAVAPIPEEGLGRAINDRLRRAAAPR